MDRLNPTLTLERAGADGPCRLVWMTRHHGPRIHQVAARVAAALLRIAGGETPERVLQPAALRWLRDQEILVGDIGRAPAHHPPRLEATAEPGPAPEPGAVLGADFGLEWRPGTAPALVEHSPWGGPWSRWELDHDLACTLGAPFSEDARLQPSLRALSRVGALATAAQHERRRLDRRRWLSEGARAFDHRGHAVLAGWPRPDEWASLRRYAQARVDHGFLDGDFGPGGKRRSHIYDDPAFGPLHRRAAALASALTGRPLVPSYSFLSIYHRGGALPGHRDKPHCVVSMSLALEACPEWPLRVEDLDGRRDSLHWSDGQLALIDGRRIAHARPPLPSGRAIYLILHFQPDPEAHP